MVYVDESWGSSWGPSPQGGEYLSKRVRAVGEDGIHEVKLSSAVSDALKDARYNYDLELETPASQINPARSITLRLPAGNGLIVVKSELYTVEQQIVNGRSIAVRRVPSQKLIIARN